jgi:dihydrofolate reductase
MRRSDAHESLHVRLIPSDGRMSQCCVAAPAAGDRNVLVHGAYTAQRAHEAGVLDELQIDQIPVLFGGGRSQPRPSPWKDVQSWG